MTFIGCLWEWGSALRHWLNCHWNGGAGLQFIQPWCEDHKKGNNICRHANRVRMRSCYRQQSISNSQHSSVLIKAIKNIWSIFLVKGQLGGICFSVSQACFRAVCMIYFLFEKIHESFHLEMWIQLLLFLYCYVVFSLPSQFSFPVTCFFCLSRQ